MAPRRSADFGKGAEAVVARLEEKAHNIEKEIGKLTDSVKGYDEHLRQVHAAFDALVDDVRELKMRLPEGRFAKLEDAIEDLRRRIVKLELIPKGARWAKGFLVKALEISVTILTLFALLKATG